MLESILPILLEYWPAALFLIFVAYLVSNRFNHGLQKYPGPFLASLTDWWRFVDVWGRRPDVTPIKLHRQHGDVVRLGPNALSFADPKALKTIYGLNKGFTKVVRLLSSSADYVQGGTSPLNLLDHGRAIPRTSNSTPTYDAVNSAFSMSSLVQYEPFVDKTTEVFLDQTERLFASKNAVCDFAQWLQFYAFDVIGEMTYSKRHGSVDRGEDVDGMVSYLGKLFSYVAPIGQMPWLDLLVLKNPILRFLDRHDVMSFTFPVVTFAKKHMNERLAEMQERKAKGIDEFADRRGDLLSMFIKAKADRPDFMTDTQVLTLAVSMAFAGSETTAISLAAVFYYLLKNPHCYQKLLEDIDGAIEDGTIENRSTGLVTCAESQKLPYLDACVKEAFRLHPAAGLTLERVVPPQGAEICGEHIPGGTIPGCNAWVIHRRPEISGEDADGYRPGRWLEAGKEELKEMNGTMFQFGMGARTCIGKNISLLEVYKLVPSFLRRFEVNLVDPDKDWKLHNAWFVKQLNFYTIFKPRQMIAG